MAEKKPKRKCKKCGQELAEVNFYKKRNGEFVDICKKCLTMHVNNFDESTYLWILEELDFPYVEHLWQSHRDKAYAKNRNLTGMSVLGSYLGSMRLKAWKSYGWADGPKLNEEHRRQLEAQNMEPDEDYEAQLKEQLDNGEITEAQYRTLSSSAAQNELDAENDISAESEQVSASSNAFVVNADQANSMTPEAIAFGGNPFVESSFIPEDELIDVGADLTHDDKIYLAMKWGRFYRPSEWVALEEDYTRYMNSFDIHDADTENALLELCKVNLKTHQALDSNDVDTAQKYTKMQEMLRKSSKFTAAQAKEEEKDFVDSVGELVAYCERNGGAIPRYELETPYDYVDVEMKDTQDYLRHLIYEDPTIMNVIESYIKKRDISKEMTQNDEQQILEGKDGLDISENDYLDYSDSILEQEKEDAEVLS